MSIPYQNPYSQQLGAYADHLKGLGIDPNQYVVAKSIYTNPPISGAVTYQPIVDDPVKDPVKVGQEVLQHVEALETQRIGQLSIDIHSRIATLRAQISLTNHQWKQFAEMAALVRDLIGDDPYDSEPSDTN